MLADNLQKAVQQLTFLVYRSDQYDGRRKFRCAGQISCQLGIRVLTCIMGFTFGQFCYGITWATLVFSYNFCEHAVQDKCMVWPRYALPHAIQGNIQALLKCN